MRTRFRCRCRGGRRDRRYAVPCRTQHAPGVRLPGHDQKRPPRPRGRPATPGWNRFAVTGRWPNLYFDLTLWYSQFFGDHLMAARVKSWRPPLKGNRSASPGLGMVEMRDLVGPPRYPIAGILGAPAIGLD